MTTFDPNAFMTSQFTEASETKFVACPEGEFPAVITDVDAATWQSRDGTKSGLKLELVWSVDDETVRQVTGMAKPQVKQSIMLDMTESGGLATGPNKNVNLGRLREAVGQNQSGKPWTPMMLLNQIARVTVRHRLYEDQIFAEVKGVAKL